MRLHHGLALLVALAALLPAPGRALHEDQAGATDWGIQSVGVPSAAAFRERSVYVASAAAGTVASLNARTGAPQWRHVLPEGERVAALLPHKKVVTSVSADGRVRAFEGPSGGLVWDARVPLARGGLRGAAVAPSDDVLLADAAAVHVVAALDGRVLRSLAVDGVADVRAVGAAADVVAGCSAAGLLALAPLARDLRAAEPVAATSSAAVDCATVAVAGGWAAAALADGSGVVLLGPSGDEVVVPEAGVTAVRAVSADPAAAAAAALFAIATGEGETVVDAASGGAVLARGAAAVGLSAPLEMVEGKQALVAVSAADGQLTTTDAAGKPYSSIPARPFTTTAAAVRVFPSLFMKKDGELASRALVVTADDGLHMLQGAKTVWTREEALASVTAVEFALLPRANLDDAVAHMDHMPSFSERLRLQAERVMQWPANVAGLLASLRAPSAEQGQRSAAESALFGFNQVAVALTRSGKVVALSMETGEVVWARFVPGARWMVSLRRQHALGLDPEVLLVSPAGDAVLLNAVTGEQTAAERVDVGPGGVVQVVPLPPRDHDRSALVVGAERAVVAPAGSDSVDPALVLHALDWEGGELRGFRVLAGGAVQDAWTVAFPRGHAVAAAAAAVDGEVVDSQAHIVGDDSLLLKYLNPHLVAVATVGEAGSAHADGCASAVTVHLIDAVSGRVVHRAEHANAAGPVQLAVSENWVAYGYRACGGQVRRTEISAMALYEDVVDKYGVNPFTQPEQDEVFSAYAAPTPIVLHKSYAAPGSLASVGFSQTRHGITHKSLLLGLATGQVYALPRAAVDPRRPPEPSDRDKAEGLMPYHPQLQLRPTAMLSYNQTVARLAHIHSAPALLESTSLVFARGLDIFCARVAPSKTFDLLSEDFNFGLLVTLLAALSVGTVWGARMLRRKRLLAAWA